MAKKNPPGVLLRRYNDWSAGIGHLADDGRTPGMAYASGLLGLRGELRPAPFLNVVPSGILSPVSVYNFSAVGVKFHHTVLTLNPEGTTEVAANGTPTTGKVTGTSLTFSLTVDAGSNQVLLVTVSNTSSADPTGVTFNGDALTLVGIGDDVRRTTYWYKVGPTVTTGDVVVSISGSTDVIASAQPYVNVDQSDPIGGFSIDFGTDAAGFDLERVTTSVEDLGMLIATCTIDDLSESATPDKAQTEILDDSQGSIEVSSSYITVRNAQRFQFQYFLEANANADDTHPFLYAMRSERQGYGYILHKIDLSNGDFATLETGSHSVLGDDGLPLAGQPAKYEGFWWFPVGNDRKPRKLSIVGVGDVSTDTLDASATPFVPGADHMTA
ncbi:hypothetical protein LCGC14_2069150, partial [marine sediment metagenome]